MLNNQINQDKVVIYYLTFFNYSFIQAKSVKISASLASIFAASSSSTFSSSFLILQLRLLQVAQRVKTNTTNVIRVSGFVM